MSFGAQPRTKLVTLSKSPASPHLRVLIREMGMNPTPLGWECSEQEPIQSKCSLNMSFCPSGLFSFFIVSGRFCTPISGDSGLRQMETLRGLSACGEGGGPWDAPLFFHSSWGL